MKGVIGVGGMTRCGIMYVGDEDEVETDGLTRRDELGD